MRLKIFLGSGRWIVLLDVPVPQGIRGTSFVYFKATNVPINRVKYILAVHTLNHCLLVLTNDDVWITLVILVLCESREYWNSCFVHVRSSFT